LFVLNKMDRRSLISAKEIEAHIKHPVAAQLPVDEVTAVSSINKGVPFVNDPRGKSTALAQAVIQLADKVMVELQPVEEISMPAAAAETSEDVARNGWDVYSIGNAGVGWRIMVLRRFSLKTSQG